MARARDEGVKRAHLSCGNQAHAYAAMPDDDKAALVRESAGNLGIVTAYNDMLSAHQPYETYPRADPPRRARGRRHRPGGGRRARRCATASPKARPAWSSASSPAT